jgi:hypothetical protein
MGLPGGWGGDGHAEKKGFLQFNLPSVARLTGGFPRRINGWQAAGESESNQQPNLL